MFKNGLNVGLPQRTGFEKIVHRVETYWLSGKEKVPVAVVKKKSLNSASYH